MDSIYLTKVRKISYFLHVQNKKVLGKRCYTMFSFVATYLVPDKSICCAWCEFLFNFKRWRNVTWKYSKSSVQAGFSRGKNPHRPDIFLDVVSYYCILDTNFLKNIFIFGSIFPILWSSIEDHTMATMRHKSHISMGRNFNNILKYYALSSNFSGYLKLLRVIFKNGIKIF